MEHQIGCTLRRAMFEKALSDTLAGFKEEGHVGVDLMELPHEVAGNGDQWDRSEGGKFAKGTEAYYLYPDGSPKKPPRTYTPTNCTPPDVTRGKGEVLGAKGEDWRAEGGKFQPGTEGYYLYPDGSPKKPPRCRAYAEYGFNSGCGCPLPLGHDGDHGGKGEVQ